MNSSKQAQVPELIQKTQTIALNNHQEETKIENMQNAYFAADQVERYQQQRSQVRGLEGRLPNQIPGHIQVPIGITIANARGPLSEDDDQQIKNAYQNLANKLECQDQGGLPLTQRSQPIQTTDANILTGLNKSADLRDLNKEDAMAHLTRRPSDLVLPGIRSKQSAIIDVEITAGSKKLNQDGSKLKDLREAKARPSQGNVDSGSQLDDDRQQFASNPQQLNSTVVRGQNGISNLNECLNEILQKPRRDSDISKYNQQIIDGARLSQRDKPSEQSNTGKDAPDGTKHLSKKRMRKRNEKNATGDEQSEKIQSNLKRAETKVYQEDKQRQIIESDINQALQKSNTLTLQKYPTQLPSSKIRGSGITNQNFAEDLCRSGDASAHRGNQLEFKSECNQNQQGNVQHQHRMGRWTKDEHFRFLVALKLYGKEWRKVQEHVRTRTSTQARSHAQKFFQKLEKREQNLEEFLKALDVDNLEKHCIMSDLEDEGAVNTGPRGKNRQRQRQGNRNNRNSTLLIPDVSAAIKQKQAQQSDEANDQNVTASKNQPSTNVARQEVPQNSTQIAATAGNNDTSGSKEAIVGSKRATVQSSGGNKLQVKSKASEQSESSSSSSKNSQSKSSSSKQLPETVKVTTPLEQSPKLQKEVGQSSRLLAKRINQQTEIERNNEFQQPLPKKSCQAVHKQSPQIEQQQITSDEKNGRAGDLLKTNMRSQFDSQRKQQTRPLHQRHSQNMTPHLQTQPLIEFTKPMDVADKLQQTQPSGNYQHHGSSAHKISQPMDVRQPANNGIYNFQSALGPTMTGPLNVQTRQHSNSISHGTTRPHSSLINPQKMNSVVVGNNYQNNSQISAMTNNMQQNINNQYPMTPNLRPASVINNPMTENVLDLHGQNYSVQSQLSNSQYQHMLNGKDKPRASSFDEQIFNNIFYKEDENDEIEENQILPHIHSALVNHYVKDQMPKDAQFIGDADALARLNMTPKTKYPTMYNSVMNPALNSCNNTLGFDDGLQRVRSNFRRVDSSDHFAIDNNASIRPDIQLGSVATAAVRNQKDEQHWNLIQQSDMNLMQLGQSQRQPDMQAIHTALSQQRSLPNNFHDMNTSLSTLLSQQQPAVSQSQALSSLFQNPSTSQTFQKQMLNLQQQQQVSSELEQHAAAALAMRCPQPAPHLQQPSQDAPSSIFNLLQSTQVPQTNTSIAPKQPLIAAPSQTPLQQLQSGSMIHLGMVNPQSQQTQQSFQSLQQQQHVKLQIQQELIAAAAQTMGNGSSGQQIMQQQQQKSQQMQQAITISGPQQVYPNQNASDGPAVNFSHGQMQGQHQMVPNAQFYQKQQQVTMVRQQHQLIPQTEAGNRWKDKALIGEQQVTEPQQQELAGNQPQDMNNNCQDAGQVMPGMGMPTMQFGDAYTLVGGSGSHNKC